MPSGRFAAQASWSARNILWAAGLAASPAATWLHVAADRAGRIEVLDDLSIPNHPEIFAIGDCISKSWGKESLLRASLPSQSRWAATLRP
jgi:NADH dehydrogenase FAD-containing subunit